MNYLNQLTGLSAKYLSYCLFISFFILLTTFCTEEKMVLVNKADSEYEIVVSDNAGSLEIKAASELQFYIEKSTSLKLPISNISEVKEGKRKILVGMNKQDLSEHQILIENNGNDLLITGGSPRATLNAAYEFLEKYVGCRWYSPEVEKVPQIKTLSIRLPLSYSYTPEITTRTVHSKLFYENHDFADKQKVTYEAFPGYVPGARVHTFNRFVPEKNFYHNHPEYYALRGEKRLPTQLCLTNPDVLNIVKDTVRAYFDRNPDADILSVSQDDNTQHCQCDDCRKIDEAEGSPSATMIRFVNAIAEEFPDKTISTLAYQYTRKPCKTKPAKNVLITLCSIECDRSAPIEDKCSAFAEDLIAWKELTGNIRIWDYTTQFTNFLAPFPNIHTLQPNIKFFRNNNARWVFEQHSHNPSELFELRSYLMAKLLWNPDIDQEEVITDFVTGYYEEAGSLIEEYIDLVHAELAKNPDFFLFLYGDPSQGFDSFLRPEMLKKYNDLFDQAEVAVADKPEVFSRIKVARLSTNYATLEAAKQNISEDFSMVVTDDSGKKKVSPLVSQGLDNFSTTCEINGITAMNEMRLTVDEYLGFYRKTLERAVLPNIAHGAKVFLLTNPKKYANENPQALTDGALGGNSFYSNYLGFEGNDMEAVIDFGEIKEISHINTSFLQVSNHIVFLPKEVSFYFSDDNKDFKFLVSKKNPKPLNPESKINDIEYFNLNFQPQKLRYLKVVADNLDKAPVWHNAAGLPAWIFCDEVIVY